VWYSVGTWCCRGRGPERAAPDRLLSTVRAGGGAALVVRGEPGVGKTALLEYAVDRAAGCRVVRASGVESEIQLAFGALHQLCAALVDRCDALAQPQADLLRERALASVDDPNTTLAIFEWGAEDGCAVDDWDARAQGTLGLGWTVSHEAILSSLVMDPPRCQDRGDVPERPVARRTRSPLAWSSCAHPAQTIRAPSAFTDHEPDDRFAQCVTQCRGVDSLEPPGKIELAPLPRPAGPDCRRDNNISVAVGLSYNRPSGGTGP